MEGGDHPLTDPPGSENRKAPEALFTDDAFTRKATVVVETWAAGD